MCGRTSVVPAAQPVETQAPVTHYNVRERPSHSGSLALPVASPRQMQEVPVAQGEQHADLTFHSVQYSVYSAVRSDSDLVVEAEQVSDGSRWLGVFTRQCPRYGASLLHIVIIFQMSRR
jgi:hypothetical protein